MNGKIEMTPLQQAATALLEEWGGRRTHDCLMELRKALADEQAQAVEPTTTKTEQVAGAISKHISTPLIQREVIAAAQYIAHRYMRPAPPAPPPAGERAHQGHDFSVNLLEKLQKTLTNLGYGTPEGGIESFNAQLEMQLYHLCEGVGSLLKGFNEAQQVAVPCGQQMRDYAEARIHADRAARQFEQGPCGWMQNIDKAMQEPLFNELRGIMGTENTGQDIALLQTIRQYRAKRPQGDKP